MSETKQARWLLLIHQIPPKPDYLRVKIGRRLGKLGAVAIKNSVYALPRSDGAHEDFQWVLREIAEGGGDAYVCEARFVEGLSDAQVEALFHAARDADYAQLAEQAREAGRALPRKGALDEAQRARLGADLARLRKRAAEIAQIDFFAAPGREAVEGLLAGLEKRQHEGGEKPARVEAATEAHRGRTWVTRKGVHVDRIASAWLIRRFIDPEASFRFVVAKDYRHAPGELRFDMYDAEFTHEGDRCSFEVLADRFALKEPALRALGELVHDLDLKDEKFARPETAGLGALLAGLCWNHASDEERLRVGGAMFDGVYEFFRRRG